MKKIYWSIMSCVMGIGLYGQASVLNKDSIPQYLSVLTEQSCGCIDSIDVVNKSVQEITSAVNFCIEKKISEELLQTFILASTDPSCRRKRRNAIVQDGLTRLRTKETIYYIVERSLMDSCAVIRKKMWMYGDFETTHEFSEDVLALYYYDEGVAYTQNNDFRKAANQFKLALRIDSFFVSAWNNLGICYKNLKQYDSAIIAYNNALVYDSTNLLLLINLAIVYELLADFDQAIAIYGYLQKTHADKPIVNLRLGYIYAFNLKNIERGLMLLCKAYNGYLLQKSPYRADVEKIILIIYQEMKSKGREKKFYKILKNNQIY